METVLIEGKVYQKVTVTIDRDFLPCLGCAFYEQPGCLMAPDCEDIIFVEIKPEEEAK